MAALAPKSEPNGAAKTALRCLEFYSGMGGLHYALMGACKHLEERGREIKAEVALAFDINTIANQVYQDNFGAKTVSPKTILSFTPEYLDKLASSDIWLLSPPCQPYTRQGKQRDIEDPRAESFLHLLTVIPKLSRPPSRLLIENVVGFESSETRERLVVMLTSCGYRFQEFHLSPHQIAIPNSRMRYFCLASRVSHPQESHHPQDDPSCILTSLPGCHFFRDGETSTPAPLSAYLENVDPASEAYAEFYERYKVPESVLLKSGMSFDLVFPFSTRSCCVTKNYGRLVEGTGSVLQTASPEVKGVPDQLESLKDLRLRYLAPREIARLHGFPETCSLRSVTDKQAYALLGNSLNVTLVTELLIYLLEWQDNVTV